MTAVNAPPFTADRGYKSDGATSYLNTNWNPLSAPSPKFTQNNHSMGVWCRNDVSAFNQCDIGHYARVHIASRNGTAMQVYASANSSTGTLPVATSVGFSSWSKISNTQARLYKNGSPLVTATVTTAAPANLPFLVCAGNQGAGVTGFSTRELAAMFFGSQLSDAEHAALHSALSTYLVAVGAA